VSQQPKEDVRDLEQELFENEEDEHLCWQELKEFDDQANSKRLNINALC
jgi:hypothetical protein